MKEMYARVRGRVQMVMFRDFTRRAARSLCLSGYVRNLEDGTVEVLAQGDEEKLEMLARKLRRGSLLSRVEGVEVELRIPRERFDAFSIVY